MDVGAYGSAFKTCKGLVERYGADRVIDMPIAESAIMGFALGASQTGAEPIIEFQFADFSTEAVTQLGLNASTWYFRTACPAPMLVRLPCGGGMTMGAFHSGEFEGLWSRFPGLKLLYPATPQETYEALLAAFYDPNPCLVFEHKLLYWSRSGDIDFNGDLRAVWRPRRYTEGTDLTLVALGAMVHPSLAAAAQSGMSVEVWNPMVLQPLEIGPIAESVEKTGRLLVVQESGATQGLGDRLISLLTRECFPALKAAPELISTPDVPVPFAPELEAAYRPNQEQIRKAITAISSAERLRKVA
jgi:2-oxoisovalerate dehydrogenase E1 component